jgi:molybdopterin-guanine dinucleotide biosynthesis protein A
VARDTAFLLHPQSEGAAGARPNLTGVVLAGGSSRRMGTDKAFLRIGEMSMIERVLTALRAACADVIVVAKVAAASAASYAHLRARIVHDEVEEQAPLMGLRAGLRALGTPWAFVASCDLPFLSAGAVRLLADLAPGYDAVAPRIDGRWHPLHAVYAATALDIVERVAQSGERRMTATLAALRVRAVSDAELRAADPALDTLRNINTPEEYAAASRETRV